MTDKRCGDGRSATVPLSWLVASALIARDPNSIKDNKSRTNAARHWLLFGSQGWSVFEGFLKDWQHKYVLLPIFCCSAMQLEIKSLLVSIILKLETIWKRPHIYDINLLVTYKLSRGKNLSLKVVCPSLCLKLPLVLFKCITKTLTWYRHNN